MQKANLDRDIIEILEVFPKLKLLEKDKRKSLYGEIDIFDFVGNYVTSYEIKVILPINYPYGFPLLFETGNKFEHVEYRHVNDDGSCCVCSLKEADLVKQKGIPIKAFFLKYVIPYLANQVYFETAGEWANGDYDHGIEGILQFYKELFTIDNLEKVISLLSFLGFTKLNRNDKCYCGKNAKLKYCHFEIYKTIKNFTKYRVSCDILALKSLDKQIKNE